MFKKKRTLRYLDFRLIGYTPIEGDVIVLEFAAHIDQEQAATIKAKVEPIVAPAKVLLLGDSVRIVRPM